MKIDLIDGESFMSIFSTTMRTNFALCLVGVAVWVAPISRADIVCGAPGVTPGSKVATKVPFVVDATLSNCYKFIFAGIEAKGNTKGAPGSSGTSGNGGQFHVSAKVSCTQQGAQNNANNCNNGGGGSSGCYGGGSGYGGGWCEGGSYGGLDDCDGGGCDGGGSSTKIKSGKIEFRDIQDFNTCDLRTVTASPPEVYVANTNPITVDIEWRGEGNAKKPDGIFNIIGEYQKNPPAPTGSLNFAVGTFMLQLEGGSQNPDGTATIIRE